MKHCNNCSVAYYQSYIFSSVDKIKGFRGKIDMWLEYIENGSNEMFQNLCPFEGDYDVEHLNGLHT